MEPRNSLDSFVYQNYPGIPVLGSESRISMDGLPTLPSQKILRKKSVEDFVKGFQMEKEVEQEMFLDAELSIMAHVLVFFFSQFVDTFQVSESFF